MTNDIVIKGKFSTSKDPNDFIENFKNFVQKKKLYLVEELMYLNLLNMKK